MYQEHKDKGVEILSVAVDVQGPEKARPFVEKAGARFVTVVDEDNSLGRLYGFKAIPNGYLIDEDGTVRYKKLGGFDIRKPETAQIVREWIAEGATSAEGSGAEFGGDHDRANDHFVHGMDLYRSGRVQEALAEWRKGAELEPDNWIIRKQLWAVENPDKFYAGAVDFDWQKEQIAKGL